MQYSDKFKSRMIAKLLEPNAQSANALAEEVGVSQATLSRWLRGAKLAPMAKKIKAKKSKRRWSPDDKVRVVLEATALSGSELGVYLRREGLHDADLDRFRADVTEAASEGLRARSRRDSGAEGDSAAPQGAGAQGEGPRRDGSFVGAAGKMGRLPRGGRGRRHPREERLKIVSLLDEAQLAGSRLKPACAVLELDPRTIQRWRASGGGDDRRHGPKTKPANKLSDAERRKVLATANSAEFRNLSPKQIVPKLADRGEYLASESTFYRVLREADQLAHRGRAKAPTSTHRPNAYAATGPNQVWSWDITYLR
ncbi:MAG: transposase-like protein [Bradymonadia bacterium]|jgi:transposase-like protein